MKSEVHFYKFCNGWVNVWTTYDDKNNAIPTQFNTHEDAMNELDSFIANMQKEYEEGNIDSPEEYDDYLIVKVNNE